MTDVNPLPRRGGLLTIVALGSVALVLVAWALLGGGGDGSAAPGTTGPGPTGGVAVGKPAPSFSVRLLGGGAFSLDEHLADGGGPLIVNFWASWCIPCRAEMPALDAASRRHPEVLFLGIATDDTVAAAERFAAEVSVGYPLAIDSTGVIAADFATFGLPTTYAIGSDGVVRGVAYGELGAADIDDLVAKAISP